MSLGRTVSVQIVPGVETVMTRARLVASAMAMAIILGMAAPSDAQWLKDRTPGIPRAEDGKPNLHAPAPRGHDGRPDLSGIWMGAAGGYANDLTSDLKPEEVLPWADALFKQRSEEFGTANPAYRCMPDIGPFYSFGMFKILQTPQALGVLSEAGVYRQILADGRDLPQDPNPTWMGYSVGRWDGDTFVVASAGFNDKTWLDFNGHPHTEALRVTERYRRKNFGLMEIEMTFEDLKAYTRPWTISFVARLAPDTELLEYVCNENEKDVPHFVITDEDRRKARASGIVSAEVLARYEGTYELEIPTGGKRPFVVALTGTQLTVQPPAGGKYTLVAESPTVFSLSGQKVEFFLNAQGRPTHFVITTVEGERRADRK